MSTRSIDSRVWVVIPAYQEERVIRDVVAEVRSSYAHVVVIDDGSADRTGSEALAGGATLITHPINLGQGAALQTGITYALSQDAEYIATFDADGQHRVEDLDRMLDEIETSGCDLVLGSRFLGQVVNLPPARRLLLRLAVAFTNLTSGAHLTDAHNGLRLLSAKAARAISITQSGMAHASEIIEQIQTHRLIYREVPVAILYTEYSLEKGQRLTGAFRILRDLFLGWIGK